MRRSPCWFTQRRAVASVAARKGRTETDCGVANNERRFARFRFCFLYRFSDGVYVVTVFNVDNLPALSLVASRNVFGERNVRITLDGYFVIVIENDEFAEL